MPPNVDLPQTVDVPTTVADTSVADSDEDASNAEDGDEALAANDVTSAVVDDGGDSGVNIRVAVSISRSAHHVHEAERQRAYDPMHSLPCVPHNKQVLTHVDVTNDDSQSAFTCAISSSLPLKERGKRDADHTIPTQYSSCGYVDNITTTWVYMPSSSTTPAIYYAMIIRLRRQTLCPIC